MTEGFVQPPDPEARYHGKPIPPKYVMVYVTWTADDFENDELGIPTEEGSRTISSALGSHLLWNKVDIAFETWKPASKPSQLLVCPSGAPSDDDYSKSGDDNGGDSNGNAGVPANTP